MQKFKIDKYDIQANKGLCGTARFCKSKSCDPNNKCIYLNVQIIKQEIDNNNNGCNIEDLLWESEKHWQAQLITIYDLYYY